MAIVPASSGSGGSSSSGALTQLYNLVRATDGTFDQATIAQTYNHLLLVGNLRSNRAASFDQIVLQFNGDTGNNYGDQWDYGAGATATAQQHNTTGNPQTMDAVGNSATAGFATGVHIWIPNYAGTTWKKTAIITWGSGIGIAAGNMETGVVHLQWNSTAAINRIVCSPITGTAFITGSTLSIYGVL